MFEMVECLNKTQFFIGHFKTRFLLVKPNYAFYWLNKRTSFEIVFVLTMTNLKKIQIQDSHFSFTLQQMLLSKQYFSGLEIK